MQPQNASPFMLGYILNIPVYFNAQVHILDIENLEILMMVLMKTSALIGAVMLLGTISYSNDSFAHPPDGYGIPEKYRSIEKPQTETVVAPSEKTQVEDDKQNRTVTSKECQAIMERIKKQTEDDGVWGTKKQDISSAKDIDAKKIKACKTG